MLGCWRCSPQCPVQAVGPPSLPALPTALAQLVRTMRQGHSWGLALFDAVLGWMVRANDERGRMAGYAMLCVTGGGARGTSLRSGPASTFVSAFLLRPYFPGQCFLPDFVHPTPPPSHAADIHVSENFDQRTFSAAQDRCKTNQTVQYRNQDDVSIQVMSEPRG